MISECQMTTKVIYCTCKNWVNEHSQLHIRCTTWVFKCRIS